MDIMERFILIARRPFSILILAICLLFLSGANWSGQRESKGVVVNVTVGSSGVIVRRTFSFRGKPVVTEIVVPNDLWLDAASRIKEK